MKYILILGLAFASMSTTVFAGKPTDAGPTIGEDESGPGPAKVNITRPSR